MCPTIAGGEEMRLQGWNESGDMLDCVRGQDGEVSLSMEQ